MPVGNASSQTPRRDRLYDDPTERWAMPLGSVAGTRLSLSYTVFFAAAILLAVVLTLAGNPGNSDLPRSAALGVGFWIAGWLAQTLTHFALAGSLGLPMKQLTIGLIGVEAQPRHWPASRSLVIAVSTVASLLLLGCFFRLAEGGFHLPVLSEPSSEILTSPSIGFTSHDSIWRSGAWLCWVQAIFQMYPLPRSMGRQTTAALVFICGRKFDLPTQTVLFRRCLLAVAVMTVLLAVWSMSVDKQDSALKWPLLLLLGVFLWVSARGRDTAGMLAGFQSPLLGRHSPSDSPGAQRRSQNRSVLYRIRQRIESRRHGRRIKIAFERERSEAVDAVRLDEILNRLHRDGIDSLCTEDREILDRVSKNLRNQRRSDSQQAEESP